MNYKCILLLSIIYLSITSCDDDELIKTETIVMNQRYADNFANDSLREYKLNTALKDGDSSSYVSVVHDYEYGGEKYSRYELFYYSMKMHSKYKTSFAYFDAHSFFKQLNPEDKFYQVLAEYYLYQAYLTGRKSAIEKLERRYGKGNIPVDKINSYIKSIDDFIDNIDLKVYDNETYRDDWDRTPKK